MHLEGSSFRFCVQGGGWWQTISPMASSMEAEVTAEPAAGTMQVQRQPELEGSSVGRMLLNLSTWIPTLFLFFIMFS